MDYEYGTEHYYTPHSMYYQLYPMMYMPYYHPYYMQQMHENNMLSDNMYMPREQTMPANAVHHERVMDSPQLEQVDKKVIQQFMNEDGQVDIQKMLQTVGQFADTVQQVSPVIKQLNELIRSFRTT